MIGQCFHQVLFWFQFIKLICLIFPKDKLLEFEVWRQTSCLHSYWQCHPPVMYTNQVINSTTSLAWTQGIENQVEWPHMEAIRQMWKVTLWTTQLYWSIGKKEVFAYARRCLLLHIFGAGDDLRCGINISFVILGCNFVLTKNDVTFVVLVVTLWNIFHYLFLALGGGRVACNDSLNSLKSLYLWTGSRHGSPGIAKDSGPVGYCLLERAQDALGDSLASVLS